MRVQKWLVSLRKDLNLCQNDSSRCEKTRIRAKMTPLTTKKTGYVQIYVICAKKTWICVGKRDIFKTYTSGPPSLTTKRPKYVQMRRVYVCVNICIYIQERHLGPACWGTSFADYRLFYMALLQKRPMILRSLLIVATTCPCSWTCEGPEHVVATISRLLKIIGLFCKRAI